MSPEEQAVAQQLQEEDLDFLMQGVNTPVAQMLPYTICTTLNVTAETMSP
jgi:hypothetical protein